MSTFLYSIKKKFIFVFFYFFKDFVKLKENFYENFIMKFLIIYFYIKKIILNISFSILNKKREKHNGE